MTQSSNIDLFFRLHACLDEAPVVDGVEHPAQPIVEAVVSGTESQRDGFARLIAVGDDSDFSAALLRLLGRVEVELPLDWRRHYLKTGLEFSSPLVREAAVEAVEGWGSVDLVPELEAHQESDPRLQAYIDDVINDLRGDPDG